VADGDIEWFQSGSSKIWGVLCMVLAAVVLVFAIVGTSLPVALGAVLFGQLAYASMLRPRIGLTIDDLVLRSMYSSVEIPLPAIDNVIITRTFAARVVDKDYVSPAIGRSFRDIARRDRTPAPAQGKYADLVEQRITAKIADARAMTGVPQGSDGQIALADSVERRWARVELGLFVVVLVAFVATLIV